MRRLALSPFAVPPTEDLGGKNGYIRQHPADQHARTAAASGMLFQIHDRVDGSVDFRSQTPDKQTVPEVTEDQTRSEYIADAAAGECRKVHV
ncbi:MAG: hypothetical protein AAF317_09200 [Pseudomonadota bacterium]